MEQDDELSYRASCCLSYVNFNIVQFIVTRDTQSESYIPVWWVTYSLNENAVENRTIEHRDGYRTTAAAENKLNEYKVRKVESMEFSKAVLIDHFI
jgi:hypothetical protein